MKLLLTVAVLLLGDSTWARSQDPRIKSWKTLANDNGFEFKYPDCWTVRPDNPDEMNMPVTVAHFVVAEESSSCARPLLNPPHQNLVGFTGGLDRTTKKESIKDIEQMEKHAKSNLDRKEWLFFKRLKVGPDDAVTFVKFHKDVNYTSIYWAMELFCPTVKISYSGPAIKNPDSSYYEKFKAGDIALPEPEKTIFESIRCIEPRKN